MRGTWPRVRLAIYSDASTYGGAERSAGNLLAGLQPAVETSVIGVNGDVVAQIAGYRPGTEQRVLPSVRGKWDMRAIVAHQREMWRLRPHILQASLHTPWAGQYGLMAAVTTPGVRAVAVEQLPIPSANRAQQRFKRALSRGLAAHVAVGDRAARLVESYADLPVGSVRTIFNGVPDTPLEDGRRVRAGPVVGSAGRLTDQKGFDVLVRTLPSLPNVTVLLVGDGPERDSLEGLARSLGVADRLVITGWRKDVRRYVAGVDVFALPSRFEGFPLSIVEAMLAERPVVATDVGSVGEAVVDGETGLLVPVDDVDALTSALGSLIAAPPRRTAMGRAARHRATQRFTSAAMVADFEALYKELLH